MKKPATPKSSPSEKNISREKVVRHCNSVRFPILWALLGLLSCCAPLRVFADEAASLFQQGNQQYQAGQYAEAAAAYEKILALGKENWQVYYNLGNAYFKLRQHGKAILNYERALQRNRQNEDVRFNLDLVNLAITDHIPEPPRALVVVWIDAALNFFSLEQAALFGLIFWILMFLGLMATLVAGKRSWQRLGRRVAWGAGAAGLLFALIFATLLYRQRTERYGIVLQKRVIVHSAPDAEATEAFILHEGAKFQLQEESGQWARVRLADGKVGWLRREAVEAI